MKKYLAILLTIAMAACEAPKPNEGGGGNEGGSGGGSDTSSFITELRKNAPHTVLDKEYAVAENGDLSVDSTLTYKIHSSDIEGYSAFYTTSDGLGFLAISVADDEGMRIYLEDQTTPWTSKDDVSVSNPHRLGFVSEFVDKILKKESYTILDTKYTVAENGDLSTNDVLAYKYSSEETKGTQAIYTDIDDTGYLGAALIENDTELAIYLENKSGLWGNEASVSFDPQHRIGFVSLFVDNIRKNAPHTVGGVAYTVDAATGNLSVEGTLTYKYSSEKTVGTQAIYTDIDGTGYLGVSISANFEVLKIYLKDQTTPWTTESDVSFVSRHEVGRVSALVQAVIAQGNFTLSKRTEVSENPVYKMTTIGDIVTADANETVVYTYVEDKNATQAIYAPAAESTKFAGISLPVVDPAPESVFGFFNRNKTTHLLNLYKQDGGNLTDGAYWANKDHADFIERHRVGSGYVTEPFADWDNYGKINQNISSFTQFGTASFGNTVWIIGGAEAGNGSVYKSTDAGKNWTKLSITGDFTTVFMKNAGVVAIDADNLLIVGGDSNGSTKTTIYSSSDGGTTWEKKPNYDIANPDMRRVNGPTLIMHKGEQYLLGGVGEYWENFVWKSSDNVNWTRMTSATESADGIAENSFTTRGYHATVSFKGDLYVMGGKNAGGTHKDVWKSTDDGATWTQIQADAPWGQRTSLQAVVFEDEIYVVGGANNTTKDNLIWRSPDGENWTAVPISTDAIGTRYQAGAAAITSISTDGQNTEQLDFVIFGGNGKNDTWRTGNYANPK